MLNIKEILDKENTFTVVGASNDPKKYGYKIYKKLKDMGFKVFPVNPNRETIQGDKAFPSINDLPTKPNVVSVVTPPKVSSKILQEAEKINIDTVWFQPGTFDDELLIKIKESKVETIYDKCILADGLRKI